MNPSAASSQLCGQVHLPLCASVSPSVKRGHHSDNNFMLALGAAQARPLPWACCLCLPDSLLGAPHPSPPHRRHSQPGRSGKHSVVCSRLSGSSEPQMWAEWAAARRAQAGGWGDCTPPDPPLQHRAPSGGGSGWHSQTGRRTCLGRWGGPSLLTVLPGLSSVLE